jgi:DNA-binding winged helix-turn-helix (wHTH) protein/tetratricopeptide (TPR) repeat protein
MESQVQAPAVLEPATYRFGDLRLKADGTLLRGETPVEVPAEELALLRALLARHGKVVSAAELSRAVSGEPRPSRQRLTACIESLRKILQPGECIESVARRGYRIQAISEPEETPSPRSLARLAILPFSTGYDVAEFLGMAVAEQTTEQLRNRRPAIVSVAARDSVNTLARRGLRPVEIGKLLQADRLVTGQVLATPGRYRLRAEMTRVADGAPLWVEDLMMDRKQVADLAGELANRVTSRLCRSISIQAEAAPAVRPEATTAQREASDLYLRAHHEWPNMERYRMQDAMARLLRAVELDASLTAARVDLAQLAILQCIYGYLSPRIAAATVHRTAEGISELNHQVERLLPALGWIEFHYDRDARSALRLMARAEELPYDPANVRTRAWFLSSRHRSGEAIELLSASIQSDPYSPWLQASRAWLLHLAGERDASVEQIEKAIHLASDYDNSLFFAAMILGYNGETARAVEVAETLARRSSHSDLATSAHAYALACAGRKDESHSLLERLQWLSRERFVLNTLNAATHVVLGENGAAIEELRNANETRCPWFFQILADPRLNSLKNLPEFGALESVWAAMEAEASDPA